MELPFVCGADGPTLVSCLRTDGARWFAAVATTACIACGPGTVTLKDKGSNASDTDVASADTDEATDTDSTTDDGGPGGTDGSSDSDASVDTDAVADTDVFVGPCAPPDHWTGAVPASLYTQTPYGTAYDAGIGAIAPQLGSAMSSAVYLIDDATVALVWPMGGWTGGWNSVLEDGSGALVFESPDAQTVGTRVLAAGTNGTQPPGIKTLSYTSVKARTSGHRVYVARGSGGFDYTTRQSQVTHLYGELTGVSAVACGAGADCFKVSHDGRLDLIRVPSALHVGFTVDTATDKCVEVVAPVGTYKGARSTAVFLDVADAAWIRVWSKP